MQKAVAGATTVGDLAGALSVRAEEASILEELRSGSEDAYAWLIAHYHQPVYSLVYRIINDPTDAADTTQEVFIKVFRGIKRFNGQASLKTWIYRIAIHEASNQRRWWYRHKRREYSMESPMDPQADDSTRLQDTLVDAHESPFEQFAHEEVRAAVEAELKQVQEPYRTTLILRDIEGLSYEEIADVLQVSLGTVKSRLIRGREALRKRLVPYAQKVGSELGLKAVQVADERSAKPARRVMKVEVETRR
jgi:RNA polymerase sigma-70 factor, ECF subfamily